MMTASPAAVAETMASFQSLSPQTRTPPTWRTSAPFTTLQPGHGAKRRAAHALDDDPDAAQRLAKRFHLLNIENGNRLWVDPNTSPPSSTIPSSTTTPQPPFSQPANTHTHSDWRSRSPAAAAAADELMQVEETRDRVFVHDLDAELADAVAADEDNERLIFLPDIERRLNDAPLRLLFGKRDADDRDLDASSRPTKKNNIDGTAESDTNAVVLYGVPRALSAPEQSDSVRRAIIESRARARGDLQRASRDTLLHEERGMSVDGAALDEDLVDEDAMDLG